MKILNLSLIFALFCLTVKGQEYSNKINLDKDKEYVIVSNVSNSGKIQGVEIAMTATVTTKSKVFEASQESYKIKTKIVKIKAVGEANGKKALMFDSEKPEDNTPGMSADLNDKIDIEKVLSINRLTGEITDLSSLKKNEDDAMGELMNLDGSNSGSVMEMFLLIPKGKKKGDSWYNLKNDSESKTEVVYTIKEIKDGVASIDFKTIANLKQTQNEEGINMFTHILINGSGNINVSTQTGILLKKSTINLLEGATEVMGESSIIKINSSTETMYIEK